MQTVAGFVEQGDDFVVRQARFFAVHRRGEVAYQIGHRGLQLAGFFFGKEAAATAVVVHPRPAAFTFAGIQIHVYAADDGAAFFQLVIAHIGVPHGHFFLNKVHTVQAVDLGEQSGQHATGGEVFFHFGFRKGVFGFAQFFAGIAQIPGLRLADGEFFTGKGLRFSQIFFGKRLGAFGQIVQKIEYLRGGFSHFGVQRQLGVVGKTEQASFCQGDFEAAGDVAGVVPIGIAEFAGAGHIGAVKVGAQFAIIGILHHRQIMRHLQADFIAAFAFGCGGRGKHRLRIFGNTGQAAVVVQINGEGIGGIEHVLAEASGQLRAFGLQLGKLCLLLCR